MERHRKQKDLNPAAIVDKNGNIYEVEILRWKGAIDLFPGCALGRIAEAHLSFEGTDAKLIDIHVHDDVVYDYVWWRDFIFGQKRKSFQGLGIGEQLLDLALAEARAVGAKSIWGTMSGDLARLRCWYSRKGFVCRSDSNDIRLELS